MGLPEGETNNKAGRPSGSKNIKTKQWELLADAILNEHTERFNEVLRKLEDKEFVDTYLKALSYLKPKLKAVEQRNTSSKIEVFYHNSGEYLPERKIKDDEHIYVNFGDAD